MKVKIEYTIEIDEDCREQINEWYGRTGLADRKAVKDWYEANGKSMDDDLSYMATVAQDENTRLA